MPASAGISISGVRARFRVTDIPSRIGTARDRTSRPGEIAISENRSTQDPAVGHDAQRDLEQKALRNVRGLVERMQAEEQAKSRSQKSTVIVLLAVVAVVAVLGVAMVVGLDRKTAGVNEIMIPPPQRAPAR
jgi:hypothetical protein